MKSMQGLSDAALINAYKKGNLQAFEIILSKYKDPIYQTIYMLVRDIALAEDLFQEVFIKIIQTIRKGNYTEEGKFLPWASRIARNLCMDYFRKQKATALKTMDVASPAAKNYAYQDLNTLQILEQMQSAEIVHALIEQLPNEQKQVIQMRFYEDLSFKEIAEQTGCSINTALGRMRYALINLRKLINEQSLVLQ
ncbi:MAG: sigma-70 family RNA polymerase sigma factor [Bacteroidota bacterium]|jgi:RNA polymerase sigma factor (sigma-70 family)|nr:sigma-70 family RNA polymerase sigma factor [Bacteroidota bacterium]